jgi:2'-5' RNA ligase
VADKHRDLSFESAELAVSEITLFRSELSSKGSRYTVISKHPLRVSTDYADYTD